ncbi:DUF2764 family protein [Nodosilinea nodulosa]|uniref:DUF2764 family protein n=1 Tax=Nodosilinea nodulosa TaxID=416001 RepID=UPI0002EBC8FB|nr:DUF2764 family protein [Nodosilinea nodulosa]
MSFPYYGVVSSLPFLSNDFSLNRLPISRNQLKSRLLSLVPEDREQLWVIVNFHEQLYAITSYTDEQVAQMIDAAAGQISHPRIKELFEADIAILVIVSALRQRLLGMTPVLPSGALPQQIRRNWQQPDFGLAARYAWIPEVRGYLETGQVQLLERRMDEVRWNYAVQISRDNPFTLEAIAAYLARWDILFRWSRVDQAAGQQRFDQLVGEILQNAY